MVLSKCSPTSDGAACAVIASEDFVRQHDLMQQAVEIVVQTMATDLPSTFNGKSCITVASYIIIIFVYWRKEHGTTVRVAPYERQTLKNEIKLVCYVGLKKY